MNFTRTNAGLSNLHAFFGVDYIVYVEGGYSYNIDQVLNDEYGSESFDILFWQNVVSLFAPNTKFQFRAIGTKLTLLTLANKIRDNELSHVCVAMDRDYDNFKNQQVLCKNVFYTSGYSWENDVWQTQTIEETFYLLAPLCRKTIQAGPLLAPLMIQLEKDIRWPVYADLLLSFYGGSLIPRDNPNSIILVQTNNKPTINREKLRDNIAAIKKDITKPIKAIHQIRIDPLVDCVGHLISCYSYRVLTYLIKTHTSMPSLPKDYASSAAIKVFFDNLKGGVYPKLFMHYQNYFA